jgi:GNAT superfamily N-acetyltransferase
LKRLFGRVVAEYAEFLFYAWDDEREEVIGVGHAIPAAWDGDRASLPDGGFDAVIEARFAPAPPTPTVLCALGITIAPECRGRGLSRRIIERMAEIGRDHGLDTLIAPVRPTLKHRYPLTPIERYLSWRRPDGTHLDPWLRTHERLGADIVKGRLGIGGGHRHCGGVGGMDGDGASRERRLRRVRCAGADRDRP